MNEDEIVESLEFMRDEMEEDEDVLYARDAEKSKEMARYQ